MRIIKPHSLCPECDVRIPRDGARCLCGTDWIPVLVQGPPDPPRPPTHAEAACAAAEAVYREPEDEDGRA